MRSLNSPDWVLATVLCSTPSSPSRKHSNAGRRNRLPVEVGALGWDEWVSLDELPTVAVQRPNMVMSVFCTLFFVKGEGTDLTCECFRVCAPVGHACVHMPVCLVSVSTCMCVCACTCACMCVFTMGRCCGGRFSSGLNSAGGRCLQSVLWPHFFPIIQYSGSKPQTM